MLKKFALVTAALITATAADAAMFQATYTGVVTNGGNRYGMFGPDDITGQTAVFRYIVDIGQLKSRGVDGRNAFGGDNAETPVKAVDVAINGVKLNAPVFGDLPFGNGTVEHTGSVPPFDAVGHSSLAFRENFNGTTLISQFSMFIVSRDHDFVPSNDMSLSVDYFVNPNDSVGGYFQISSRNLLRDQWNYLAYGEFRPTRIQVSLYSAVPEPATWAMLLSGLGIAGGLMRRRNVVLALG